MKNTAPMLFFLLLTISCVESFPLELQITDNALVIEARLTDEMKRMKSKSLGLLHSLQLIWIHMH